MNKVIPLLLFISFFVVSTILSPRIGPSWDEPDNIFAAGVYLNFFKNKFDPTILTLRHNDNASVYKERIFSQNTDLERYPPFPLIIGGFFASLYETLHGTMSGADVITLFHVASGLFLSITVVIVYKFVLLFKQKTITAVAAAICIGLLPPMFGHGLSTIKDSAQVAMFTSSLFFLYKYTLIDNKRWLILGSICWGLGMSTKFNAVYVPIIWIIFSLFVRIVSIWTTYNKTHEHKKTLSTVKQEVLKFAASISLFFLVGILSMIISWPYLWFDTIKRIQEVILYFTTVGTGYHVAWMGSKFIVGDTNKLWWYPISSLILTTPVPILFFSSIGIILSSIRLTTSLVEKKFKELFYVFLFLWLIIPFIRIFSSTSSFYDGMRHFMEVLPVIAIITAITIENIMTFFIKRIHSTHKKYVFLLWICTILVISIHLLFINYKLFPFSSGYLNSLTPTKKNELFDRDFSGLSLKEGMMFVNKTYTAPRIWAPIAGHLTWYYMPPDGLYVYTPYEADTIIFINKISHATQQELETMIPSDFSLVHTIKREVDTFGWIYRKK